MPWRIICGLVALFVLANANAQTSGRSWKWPERRSREPWKNPTGSDNLIDIDVETERSNAADQTWPDTEELSGSGSGMDNSDDEDLSSSGSGSGAGFIPEPEIPMHSKPTTTTTTTTPTTTTATATATTRERLSPCQQLREASQHLSGNFVPKCNAKGDYHILQCHGREDKGHCWCADLRGREIPGTYLNGSVPDCVGGTNLPRCVFQLVWQTRTTVLSTFRPRCMLSGDFEAVQCKGEICYCVDQKFGDKVARTEVFLPDRPQCQGTTTPQEEENNTPKITLFPPGPHTTPKVEDEIRTEINVVVERKGEKEDEATPEVSNETGDGGEPVKEPSSAASMMTQPGILAAIIGGSVVLLLCAILLAMFIIYRMKKKDEGSYPLDEPKKMPNYSYQRAPEKEFYA
ncbi:hypothetical protein ACOMHN_022339 [Nucella lapillus]